MTVLVEVPKVQHLTNAIQTAFPFTFRVLSAAETNVFLNDNPDPENSSEYSVVLNGDPAGQTGGEVTMNSAPATGTLTITRKTAQSQETDYNAFDPFPADTHETGLDKAMMVTQELTEVVSRGSVLPPGADPTVDYTFPAYDAGKGWMWSESGDKKIILSNDNFNDIVSSSQASADASAASSASAFNSEVEAGLSEIAADTSETNAAASETKANQWAENPEDTPVEPGEFSALHWAKKSEASSGIPAGAIMSWSVAAAPAGWLICDGSAVSRTVYAALFAVLAETYGNGDGSTTFNIPDTRGEFIRGTDSGAGNDPDAAGRTDRGDGTTGDAVGTKQTHAMEEHTHLQTMIGGGSNAEGGANARAYRQGNEQSSGVTAPVLVSTETRGRNIGFHQIIKV